jgi:hypothetical protein
MAHKAVLRTVAQIAPCDGNSGWPLQVADVDRSMSESLHAESRPAEAYSSDALPTSRPDMLERLSVTPAVPIFEAGVPIYIPN